MRGFGNLEEVAKTAVLIEFNVGLFGDDFSSWGIYYIRDGFIRAKIIKSVFIVARVSNPRFEVRALFRTIDRAVGNYQPFLFERYALGEQTREA